MAFTEKLTARKPRTASEHYDAWLDALPATEREAVVTALTDRRSWSNVQLKPILEADEDNAAPKFGMTAFRVWRNETSE
ncbi:hypothetical protein [Microbacterium sp. LWH12-1.2]|uniref:hypothetical protein n=1 Tax=Microbacterium sp. LWH12-1.2 TaxID=3135259 RepID=UPI00343C13E5